MVTACRSFSSLFPTKERRSSITDLLAGHTIPLKRLVLKGEEIVDAENFFKLSRIIPHSTFTVSHLLSCAHDHKISLLPLLGHVGWGCRMEGTSIKVSHLASGPSLPREHTSPALATLASSRLIVFKQGVILSPKGYCQCLEMFLVVTTQGRGATGTKWGEAQDAAKHSLMNMSVPQ